MVYFALFRAGTRRPRHLNIPFLSFVLGIIQFTQLIVSLEKEDDLVADLHSQIRGYYLPPVAVSNDMGL